MKLRFDYILITILALTIILSLIYLVSFFFTKSVKNRSIEYHAKLIPIDKKIELKEYQEALLEINTFLSNEDSNSNFSFHLKTRKAICFIYQGEIAKGKSILDEFIKTSPYIKITKELYNNCETPDDYVKYAYYILEQFDELENSIQEPITLTDIITNMKFSQYLLMIYIIITSCILFNRFTKNKIPE